MSSSLERRVAIDAARAAGHLLQSQFRESHRIAFKDTSIDLVTEMDARAEELIVGRLAAAFPDDSILAEERGSAPGRSGRRWIVDPLDLSRRKAGGSVGLAQTDFEAAQRAGDAVQGDLHGRP